MVSWFLCIGRLVSKTDNVMHFVCLVNPSSVDLVSQPICLLWRAESCCYIKWFHTSDCFTESARFHSSRCVAIDNNDSTRYSINTQWRYFSDVGMSAVEHQVSSVGTVYSINLENRHNDHRKVKEFSHITQSWQYSILTILYYFNLKINWI